MVTGINFHPTQHCKEHTGLEMMQMNALGQYLAHASAKSLTMDALVLKRSSLVMPVWQW